MEELLAKDEEELPMSDTKWQRRRELMAKVKEQASSEEDENPAAPPPGGSVFTKALKVSEGLYQFSEDQMAGDFPCFDATTATRLRRLQAKDVQRLLRGFEGPQLKQGGLERVAEAFYIAKMKYEHEARLSTPGQQVGNWRTGYMCKYCRGHPPPPDPGRQGHLAAGVGRTPGGPLQPLGEGAAGVLPPGGALGPVAGRLHRGPEGAPV